SRSARKCTGRRNRIMSQEKLVEIKKLKKHFKISRNEILKAVDGIEFDIYKEETFGLVGESECGKSTAGRSIMRLYQANDGEVIYIDYRVHENNASAQLKEFIQIMTLIFQDTYASLYPRMIVTDIVAEGLDIHGLVKSKKERKERVNELLATVGLNEEDGN